MQARFLLLLSVVALAGCLTENQPTATSFSAATSSDAVPPSADVPAPTEDLGALIVVVTTTELIPVEGAFVELRATDRSGRTSPAGDITFNDLDPGRYTVLAAKPGFRAREEEGRVADVVAGTTGELQLVLDPIAIVTPETSYIDVIPLRGYLACSIDAFTGLSTTFGGYSNYCGRGVAVGGQVVGANPNDNSSHTWTIQNMQVEGWWFEAVWQPSASALSDELLFSTQKSYSCLNVTCTGSGSFSSGGGPSPFRRMVTEGADRNITTKFGAEPVEFPQTINTLVRGFCTSPCASFTLEQGYSVWVSVFYGRDPPADYTALP